jgi:hypothetical protein
MRLISWTLRSGSEQLIYNWNGNNADLDQGTGASKKEWTKGNGKAKGIKVVLRQHANCQDKTDLGSKERTKSRVKATRKLSR